MWCTAERRLVRHDSTCLFQESIPAILWGNAKHPLPTRSLRSPRGTICSTNSALCLHHAHPFVAASEKSTCLMQRSKAFGQVIVVSKMFWNIVIVLSVVLWDCCKPTNACRDWAFSNSGLEVGLPAFQLPMFSKCDALPKGDLLDMFVSGVHSCHSFGKCQASTPYQKLKVAESGSTLHQLCIMLVLCLQKIPSLCWRFRICVSIELLATVGGKCGFQPFSCPCSQNLTLPKRGFLDILV